VRIQIFAGLKRVIRLFIWNIPVVNMIIELILPIQPQAISRIYLWIFLEKMGL
jgi:hypothetical protein